MNLFSKSMMSFAVFASCCAATPAFAEGHSCDGKCKGTAECTCKSCTCEVGKPCSCDASCKGHTCKEHHDKKK